MGSLALGMPMVAILSLVVPGNPYDKPLTVITNGGRYVATIAPRSSYLQVRDLSGEYAPFGEATKSDRALSVALTPDGKFAVVGGSDGRVSVVSLEKAPRVQSSWEGKGGVTTVAISADGKRVAAGLAKLGRVVLLDATSGKELRTLLELDEEDTRLGGQQFSPDGKTVLISASNGKRCLVATASGKTLWTTTDEGGARGIAFFDEGKKVAIGNDAGCVRVHDSKTGKVLMKYLPHRRTIWSLAVSADGKYIASFGLDANVVVWDREKNRNFLTVSDWYGYADLTFSKGFLHVAEGKIDKIYDLKTKKLVGPSKRQ